MKYVVKDILQALDIGVLDVARRHVGLMLHCDEVINLLKFGDKSSDRLTLGIWGMGDLGKTILSKVLYNKIHHLFEATSFVSNEAESSLKPDKHVLEVRQVDVIYPMRELELAEAMELFNWDAFLRAHPKKGCRNLTERIVKVCLALPLSSEIIGTNIYARNHIRYWTKALCNLENVGHCSVFEILKTRYDTLTPIQKHILLDIACFFVNPKSSILNQNRPFNMDFYKRFWSALGCEPVYTSLKTFEEKALTVVHEHIYREAMDEDIDEEDHAGQYFCKFYMHEKIRDMGRWIIVLFN
ncbi:hypothetical protein SUGI_0539320 [Cryptomeria japonica]|nr:hypothetical protein SUGI_0539320 [Cryptomeria japonica]